MEPAITAKDVWCLGLAAAVSFLGIFLAYAGLRAAVAPSKHHRETLPDWSIALSCIAFGMFIIGFGQFGLWISRDDDPYKVHTFRSLSGAHQWALTVVHWSGLVLGLGFIAVGVLPNVAAWWRQRRENRRLPRH